MLNDILCFVGLRASGIVNSLTVNFSGQKRSPVLSKPAYILNGSLDVYEKLISNLLENQNGWSKITKKENANMTGRIFNKVLNIKTRFSLLIKNFFMEKNPLIVPLIY